tara:strand:- start:832 stop:1752 length:921 start_codon:yes stop_codon:yes gene_type:complete
MRNIILITLALTFSSCLVSEKLNYQTVQIKETEKNTEAVKNKEEIVKVKAERIRALKQSLERKEVIYSIFFNHDQNAITNNQNVLFQSFHDSITINNTISSISISGYCNEIGGNDYNIKLSEERAHYIYQIIRKDTSLNIIVDGLGEIPNANNENIDEQLTNNRKVIITYAFNNVSDVAPTSLIDIVEGEKMILKNILFANGWYKELLPESTPTLQRLLTDLKQNRKYHIEIRGHIFDIRNYDESAVFNVDPTLSENRAKTVYNYLVDNGIESSRLSFIGLQGKYPLYKEAKDDRRVEIEVTKIQV